MALNINYQGEVRDQDNSNIDCYYQAYSHNISKWGDVHTTEASQYNVNFGDGDLNTQSGSISNGDVLLIAFWTGAPDRSEKLEMFGIVSFVYDGNDNTIQNVMILPSQPPNCRFLMQENALIESEVNVVSLASTVFQWEYEGAIMYQRKTWYGQVVFLFLDIASDEFYFKDSYDTLTSHVYDNSGAYDVLHRVKNTYELSNTCSKQIRILYRAPIGGINFSNNSPFVNESIDVSASIIDDDSRIISIRHIFDNTIVEENTDRFFVYDVSVPQLGVYSASQEILWNDGFDDMTVYYSKDLELQNKPPKVSLSYTQDDNSPELFSIEVDASDEDGTIEDICWELFYLSGVNELPDPYFRCEEPESVEYISIYNVCDKNKTSLVLAFAIPGKYRILVTATDDYGDTGSAYIELDVTEICPSVFGECPECPPVEDCQDSDCYEEIRKAVEECIRNHSSLIPTDDTEIVVVQDGRSANSASGKIGGSISGKVNTADIVATISKQLSGKVSNSSFVGKVNGKINGKVKK